MDRAFVDGFPPQVATNIQLRWRIHVSECLPDDLDGRAWVAEIEPGEVFDRMAGMSRIPDASHAMEGREALKVMGDPCT